MSGRFSSQEPTDFLELYTTLTNEWRGPIDQAGAAWESFQKKNHPKNIKEKKKPSKMPLRIIQIKKRPTRKSQKNLKDFVREFKIPRDALRSERGPGSAGGRGGDSPFYKDEHCISPDPRGGREEKEEGRERERECRQGEEEEEQRPRFVWMEGGGDSFFFFPFFTRRAFVYKQSKWPRDRPSHWKTTRILQ